MTDRRPTPARPASALRATRHDAAPTGAYGQMSPSQRVKLAIEASRAALRFATGPRVPRDR